ncbi:hypothetical protein [Enterococcus hirae]|uniref:hypothetical protein n=1 Tax=Enterococcus hirae TaxID=1354 RepID=UPI001F61BE4C|nr:hypothetical protein [Enterococcus hirae]MEB7517813.1 hypothetical protein [Enterococcus hirae]
MSNEKLDQNTLISILGEVNEATPEPAKNSANNNPSILSSAKMENSTSILGETTGSKSFMAMTADEKKIFKNAMGNIFQQNLTIQPKIVTPDPAKNSANNNPSIPSSAKMENPTSILGETTGSKSFMAMTAAEKENFKNAMGNIFQQNPSIQPKIVTPDPAKNSANNNPSILSSAKMENSTSILGETTGSKSFMAMTATEKEIFKNAMGNIFLKNLPIHQTTVIPVPITKESSKTKPSDQGEHRRKFVDVLNQIKLNNPVAQERTAESAKKEFTENTSLILPSEEKSGQPESTRIDLTENTPSKLLSGEKPEQPEPAKKDFTENTPPALTNEEKPKQPMPTRTDLTEKNYSKLQGDQKLQRSNFDIVLNQLMLNKLTVQKISVEQTVENSADDNPSKLLSGEKPKQPEPAKKEFTENIPLTLPSKEKLEQPEPTRTDLTENTSSKLEVDQEKHNNKSNQLVPKTNVKALTKFFETKSSINEACDRAKQGAELEKNRISQNTVTNGQSLSR